MEQNETNQTQQQQQQQSYQTPPQPPYQRMLPPHRGPMVLVFGIAGLVFCGIFGLLAWMFGNEDLKKMDSGSMDPSGRSLTYAGKVLGVITVVIYSVMFVFTLIPLFFALGAMAGSGAGSPFYW